MEIENMKQLVYLCQMSGSSIACQHKNTSYLERIFLLPPLFNYSEFKEQFQLFTTNMLCITVALV